MYFYLYLYCWKFFGLEYIADTQESKYIQQPFHTLIVLPEDGPQKHPQHVGVICFYNSIVIVLYFPKMGPQNTHNM